MEKKILWKFNIIDLILIGIGIVGLITLIYNIAWGGEDKDEPFLFTYICRSAPNEALEGISQGDLCMDGDYGNSLGKLTDISCSEIKDDAQNNKAVFVSAVTGIKTEHGVTIDDILYLKGKEFNLVVGDSVFSVYLSDIKSLE